MRLVDDAVLKGHRHILGLGGDGTNHELVNGIMTQTHAPSTDIHYALLPIGTGNDWARTYQIPHDPKTRLQQLLLGKTVLQDVGKVRYQIDGRVDERYFANVAGMAYDAFLVKKLDRHRMVSHLQYLLMMGRYLFAYRLLPARLRYEGIAIEDFFYTINIGICPYSGGGCGWCPTPCPTMACLLSRLPGGWPNGRCCGRLHDFTMGQFWIIPGLKVFKRSVWW